MKLLDAEPSVVSSYPKAILGQKAYERFLEKRNVQYPKKRIMNEQQEAIKLITMIQNAYGKLNNLQKSFRMTRF